MLIFIFFRIICVSLQCYFDSFFFSRLGANQSCGIANKLSVGKHYGQNKITLAVSYSLGIRVLVCFSFFQCRVVWRTTEKQIVGKTLHSSRRKLETYKVRIYQSNVHCLKQQQKNLTDDQENV